MKLSILLTLICVGSATKFTTLEDDDASTGGGFFNQLGIKNSPRLEALKAVSHAATVALEKQAELAKERLLVEAQQLVERARDNLRAEVVMDYFESLGEEENKNENSNEALDFGDAMGVCDKQDCKRRYFVQETFRWVKRALKDMGIVIHDNPKASVALFIGVSVLIANIYTGGALVPMTLKAIGFGSQGPISGTIASFIQANMGPINAGSIFAQLQSAAMGGATLAQLQQMATVAFAGLGAAGGSGLLGAGIRSFGQNADFDPAEWRAWEAESRIPYNVELVNKMPQMWKPVTAETCVAYGYREYRAAIWFVPKGADPLEVCLRTSAIIKGVGFKTPLACADQGPKKGVIGTWYVQSNETRCMPQWSNFEDEGCMQYGRRRHFSRLMGLRHQDDWNSLCESTPALINGEEIGAPTYCENKGIRGIYGIFDMPDEKCECYCRAT